MSRKKEVTPKEKSIRGFLITPAKFVLTSDDTKLVIMDTLATDDKRLTKLELKEPLTEEYVEKHFPESQILKEIPDKLEFQKTLLELTIGSGQLMMFSNNDSDEEINDKINTIIEDIKSKTKLTNLEIIDLKKKLKKAITNHIKKTTE